MTEPDWDEPRRPITVDEATSWSGPIAKLLDELVFVSQAHRDAANRCAILEAENHDLRILIGLNDNERGLVTTALGDLREAANTIRLAVAVLDGGYRDA